MNSVHVHMVTDWVELNHLDSDFPEVPIWDKVMEKVGEKHATEGSWKFGDNWLLVAFDLETKEVEWWLCEPGEEGSEEVFGIINAIRKKIKEG